MGEVLTSASHQHETPSDEVVRSGDFRPPHTPRLATDFIPRTSNARWPSISDTSTAGRERIPARPSTAVRS